MNHDDCAFVVTVLQVPVVILEATKNVEAEEDNDAKELERWVKRTIKSDDKLRIIMMETDWDYVFEYIEKNGNRGNGNHTNRGFLQRLERRDVESCRSTPYTLAVRSTYVIKSLYYRRR